MIEQVKFFDTDFLGNKIEIGDKIILETPKYRDFTIGTVVSKAPKSCQIEYISSSTETKVTVRQYYKQLIKYPIIKKGKWLNEDFPKKEATQADVAICSICRGCAHKAEHGYSILSKFCPHCGARMTEV